MTAAAGAREGTQTGVYLARHGRTAYNAEGRFQGQLPVRLDAVGREQAAALAELVAPLGLAALWCSTLARARETAEVVEARVGLPLRPDRRLVETDAGDWTGMTFEQVRGAQPDALAAFLAGEADFAFPGGESFVAQGHRVAAALRDVEQGPLPALVVCHGVVIRVALTQRRPEGLTGHLHEPIANGALVELPPDLHRHGRRAAAPVG